MTVYKGRLEIDPRGLIYESYRIEAISLEECKVIFLDWAINTPEGDMTQYLKILLGEYEADNPDHPMTKVIQEGVNYAAQPQTRKGGRMGRKTH